LGELLYLDAVDYGVSTLQCASGATGDGISNPLRKRIVANLRALGHTVRVDPEALAQVAGYFTRIAEAEGLPAGKPQGFDAAICVINCLVHDRDHAPAARGEPPLPPRRRGHRELGQVREELGWPIVMTPFAQMS